ncbi:MAG: hypothetical protein ACP5I8_06685 [Phycisphaerae bacterium]
MALTIPISPQTEVGLKRRASAVGQDVVTYTAMLLEGVIKPRTLEDLSGPVRGRFIRNGTSDAELGVELERAKHKMWTRRRTPGRK